MHNYDCQAEFVVDLMRARAPHHVKVIPHHTDSALR